MAGELSPWLVWTLRAVYVALLLMVLAVVALRTADAAVFILGRLRA